MTFLKKINKCAFVTDKKWLQWIVKVEDVLLPFFKIATFEPHDKEIAKEWLFQ